MNMPPMNMPIKITPHRADTVRGGKLPLDLAASTVVPHAATIARIIDAHRHQAGALLPILHAIQDELHYIPPESVALIAAALQRSRAEVHGVITFYPHFRQQPPQGTHLEICRAEACQARGVQQLIDHVEHAHGCALGESAADGRLTTSPVYCLGLCAQGPAVVIDGQMHAHVSPERLDALLEQAGKPQPAVETSP